MKRLDELGVSPTPWKSSVGIDVCRPCLCDANGRFMLEYTDMENRDADARLIAAAPSLYECLRNLIEACGAVGYKDGGTAACYESEHKLYRALWDAEAALYKAGGAE